MYLPVFVENEGTAAAAPELFRGHGRTIDSSICSSAKAVDTTRAGDGFVAGLLSGIANNPKVLDDDHALTELCSFANAVGAITTTARGAIPSLPTTRQVEALLSGP